jgi:hypothetical protein
MISASDVKQTTNGKMVNLTMRVLEGPAAGQLIFQNINFVHNNPVAQQIGQERLSAVCHVIGVLKPSDTAQFHGRPFKVKVAVSDDGKYNEVLSFLTEDGKSANAGAAAPAPAGPAAAPPWAAGGTPAPVAAPAPTPASAPAPAPSTELFYVAHNGQNITPTPIGADAIRALPQGLAAIQVCKVGTQQWVPGNSLQVAAPSPAAAPVAPVAPAPGTPAPGAALPPWMQAAPAPGA